MESDWQRRASEAHERAEELAERRARLEVGEPPSEDDVARATLRAEESRKHDAEAHARAAQAHRRAALAHRRAAEVADAAGESDHAAEHHAAADRDDRAAGVDDEATSGT